MLQMFLSYLLIYGVQSNIVVFNGAGALVFQREKMYRSFRYLDAIFVIIGTAIIGTIAYFLNKYVYAKFDIAYINVTVVVFLVGFYNLVVSAIWRKISYFKNYLYQKSYTYAFDFAFMLSVIFMLNMNVAIVDFLMMIAAISVVIFVMNFFVGFYVHSINRGYMNINFRDVSARLFVLAIFSILLIYASQLIV